ncbi:MAG: hypothetical protein H7338_03895 [Candidatus Sericytochromatia bacterium]|nr:hypothetical protein [Candidatus Sericytochromatia bacterium]
MTMMTGMTPMARAATLPQAGESTSRRAGLFSMGVAAGAGGALIARDRLHLQGFARPAGLGMATVAAGQIASALSPNQTDKPRHAMAFAAVTGAVSLVTGRRGWGIVAGVAAGIAKEFYDGSKFHPNGQRDFHLKGDLGADVIGIASGALI